MDDIKQLLARVGVLLYGERWQSDLAKDLEIDPRRMRQWLAGERPIRADTPERLVDLLVRRRGQISSLLVELESDQKEKG